ncbi:MAG TPA: hypothetical protein ENN72_02870 [Firmicutes bacterium]|nr:hypothetical protein [Bacillota bacterium]
MERPCPACGASLTITSYHTLLRCPWCSNTCYPFSTGNALLYRALPLLTRKESQRALGRFLQQKGHSFSAYRETTFGFHSLPFILNKKGDCIQAGEEFYAELDSYEPKTENIDPVPASECPPFYVPGGFLPHTLLLIPFFISQGELNGRPMRFLTDRVTGIVFSCDINDLNAVQMIRKNRNVILLLSLFSFFTAFFLFDHPLTALLSLSALFFLGMALFQGGRP